MTQLSTLNHYFLKYKWHFFLGLLFVILTNYFRILSPQLTGYVVNTVVQSIKTGGGSLTHQSAQAGTENYNLLIKWLITYFDQLNFQQKIFYTGLLLFGIAIISGFFMFLMRQSIIVMSRHIEFDQKNEIFAHYQQLDMSFYKSQATGDLMNRITEDVSRVRMYTGPAIMYFINLAAIIGFSIFFMFSNQKSTYLVRL